MSANKTHTAQQFSPWSIARTAWKGKWSFLIIWVVISIVGAVVVQSLPTVYSAQALILVDSQKIPERFVSSTVSTLLQDRISSISQQILSSTQLNKIISDFNLYRAERNSMVQEEIIEKMRKDIEIKVDKGPGLGNNKPGSFRVGYQGSNPTIVAQVANKLSELFINENLKSRSVQAEGTSEFIESQLQESKKNLDKLEASVSEYKLKHNGELPQQENALGTTMARLQGELNATRDAISRGADAKLMQQSSLTTAEATLQALVEQASVAASLPATGGPVVRSAIDPNTGTRVVVAAKRSDILRAQLETAKLRWKDDHPEIKRLKADIEQAEQIEQGQEAVALAATKATLAAKTPEPPPAPPKATETVPQTSVAVTVPAPPSNLRDTPQLMQLRERIGALKIEMELTARDIEKRKANEQRLLASLTDVQSRIERLPVREQEMAVLMRDYGISKDNYQRLLANKISAEMSKDMELRQKSERFTVLDSATVPERPSKPNRRVLTSGISGFGALLGLVFVFLMEFRRDVLLGEWELPEGVVVLGMLPRMEDCATTGPAKSPTSKRPLFRKRAIVSSAVLGALAIAAAGLYLVRTRF